MWQAATLTYAGSIPVSNSQRYRRDPRRSGSKPRDVSTGLTAANLTACATWGYGVVVTLSPLKPEPMVRSHVPLPNGLSYNGKYSDLISRRQRSNSSQANQYLCSSTEEQQATNLRCCAFESCQGYQGERKRTGVRTCLLNTVCPTGFGNRTPASPL